MAHQLKGKFIVGKPFERDGVRLESGTVVLVDDWPNAEKLVRYRYLREMPQAGSPSPMSSPGGSLAAVQEAMAPSGAACLRCLAVGDEPCRSKSGKVTLRHAARPDGGV